MDTPQEIQVWYILPALRRQLAITLRKEGMKQKEIATAIGLTEAAVSQYLKKKRGEETHFSKDVLDEIGKSARLIAADNTKVRSETQRLLKMISETRFICGVCHNHINSNVNCEICYD